VTKARTLFSLFAASLATGAPAVFAQGVTSAAVQGTVSRSGPAGPVEGAVVTVTNTQTGIRLQTSTRANGRYNLETVAPGGPYTIEARAIGFEASSRTGVLLTLGQRYTADFTLEARVVTLEELIVVSATDPIINEARTGPAQTVSDTAIQRLPLLGRNFTALLRTNPQVAPVGGTGISIGGQNNRFNTIQIDGGVNNDLFGLAASGTPGGQAGAKPISLEALREFQVLVAPFDVRQGSFSGGLVNAITKSGTNEFHGSFFGYFQRPSLVGDDPTGAEIATFGIEQFGGTVGGPLVRDKLHFFLSADVQSSHTPFSGFETSEPSTGVSDATANRVANFIRTNLGFDPGGPEEPEISRPDKNFFGKLSWEVGPNSLLELSHNFVDGNDDNLGRASRTRNDRDGWQLSNSGFKFQSQTNSSRAKFNTIRGSTNLEVLVAYQRIRDSRSPSNFVPLILTGADVSGTYIAAGGEKFSQANSLDQDNIEVTANVTVPVAQNHTVTFGTHNEFFKFRNVFFPGSLGVWTFASADSLEAGTPNRYERAIELRPDGPIAQFSVQQIGAYVQDQWTPIPELNLTLGLRVDAPYNDSPVRNDALASSPLAIETDNFPSGNALLSPRLGFNWDIEGTGRTSVRGGVGIFSGRPPYVWIANAYTNTGREQQTVICTGAAVPTFTVDIDNLPSQCAGTGGPPAPGIANVNYFDPDFKFQQALKVAVGVDRRLPWGVIATLDFLHTRGRNTMYLTDDNLVPGASSGEGRQLYGAFNPTSGSATPQRVSTAFRTVVRHENRSEDRSTLVTGQLQKRFSNGVEFNASYTYAKAEDLFTLTSSIATSNLNFTTLDGTLADRNLRTSGFDVPHRVTISGTVNLPFGFAGSLIYNRRSGLPYAYTVNGDANADGFFGNDLFYVPVNEADASLADPARDWAALNSFIESEPCLREQRGQLMERNTCRNPSQNFLDLRLAKYISTLTGQQLELSADFFNFPNLINGDWGQFRQTSPFENLNLIRQVGYDATANRPVYALPLSGTTPVLPGLETVQNGISRWRVQVGAKYHW